MNTFRVVILAVILLAVLSWAVYLKLGQAQKIISSKEAAVQSQIQTVISTQPVVSGASPPEQGQDWGRDPFAGPPAAGSGASGSGRSGPADQTTGLVSPLVLRGSWISSQGRVALIGEEAVAVGEAVGGWRVVRIGEDSVELSQGGQKQVLRLAESARQQE